MLAVCGELNMFIDLILFLFLFQTSSETIEREAYNRYLSESNSLPKSFQEAAEWICEKQEYTAPLPEKFAVTGNGAFKCYTQITPVLLNAYYTSMVIQKNSPYKIFLNNK